MNPVAKRLRDRNAPYGWAALAETAAIEIDRLEAEVERVRGHLVHRDAEIARLERIILRAEIGVVS